MDARTTDAQRGNSLHCTAKTYFVCHIAQPNFLEIFDLCLHWVSVVCGWTVFFLKRLSGGGRSAIENLGLPVVTFELLKEQVVLLQYLAPSSSAYLVPLKPLLDRKRKRQK